MPFQVVALPRELFSEYFTLSELELVKKNAKWIIADSKPGYPCRLSLDDAEVGEAILAISFNHLDVNSPYYAAGPIFIRKGVESAQISPNQIPQSFLLRTYSIRAYDSAGMMIDSQMGGGTDLADSFNKIFEHERVAYIHVHHAAPGCYCCAVYNMEAIASI